MLNLKNFITYLLIKYVASGVEKMLKTNIYSIFLVYEVQILIIKPLCCWLLARYPAKAIPHP